MADEFDYEAYERACARERKKNEGYLAEFERWLAASGVSAKTIQRHVDNIDYYLNTYLLYEDAHTMEEGCALSYVDDFLGYFFIRKCMWSTPATTRQYATSLKKFYKCMLEADHIPKGAYNGLLKIIKTNLSEWVAACADFNDPSRDYFDDYLGMGAGDSIDPAFVDALYDAVAQRLGMDGLPGAGGAGEADGYDEGDLPTKQEIIDELTLTLFYLTSQRVEIARGSGVMQRRARKSADESAVRFLRSIGYITCPDKGDEVSLLPEGVRRAEETLAMLGLEHLIERDEPKAKGTGSSKGWKLV